MFGRNFANPRIRRSNKLRIDLKFIKHSSVLAANRTVHHISPGPVDYRSGCSNCHGTVDYCHRGPEAVDIAGSLPDEVPDLKRVADVQDIDLVDPRG